jgi:hypothetical protein
MTVLLKWTTPAMAAVMLRGKCDRDDGAISVKVTDYTIHPRGKQHAISAWLKTQPEPVYQRYSELLRFSLSPHFLMNPLQYVKRPLTYIKVPDFILVL